MGMPLCRVPKLLILLSVWFSLKPCVPLEYITLTVSVLGATVSELLIASFLFFCVFLQG